MCSGWPATPALFSNPNPNTNPNPNPTLTLTLTLTPTQVRVAISTQDLVQRLLQQNYTKRLGCMRNGSQDVRLHRYFAPMDVPQMLKMKLPAPHVPKVKGTIPNPSYHPNPRYAQATLE